MNLAKISIRQHVLTWMLSLVLVLFGIISYQRIGVDRLPEIDFPMLSVATVLPGADPDIIDASVTNIIESAVNSVSGIESIQSSSLAGVSVVVVQFALDKNIDTAFNEIQAKLNEVLQLLPTDAKTPVLKKIEAGSQPVMWLALQGDNTLQQLNVYAKNIIKKRLETISGVGDVVIAGERRRTIRVNLDIDKLATQGVAVDEVIRAFGMEHIKLPGGFITGVRKEHQLKLDLEYHDIHELGQLIIAYRDLLPVRLNDVATIEDGLEDFRRFASFNGKPTVGLGLIKISGSNTVALIAEAKQRLKTEILPQLPPSMILTTVVDDARLIIAIVEGLQKHLVEGTLLAALVVWLFLRNMRSTLIVATAIPVSLLGAIAGIFFAGFTFNTMTLLGLLLLIGVVVDDAIVVLENIFRHMEENPDAPPEELAEKGTSQVMFAVLAATLTLVSLFGAVVFMEGIIGRFIGSFAVVVVIGVIISLFISLTLTPMLCARYLRIVKRHGVMYRFMESGFKGLENGYRAMLSFSLNQRLLIIFIAGAIVYSSGWFMGQLGKGFMPDEDEGRFIVSIKTPLGSSIDYTIDRLQRVEEIIKQHDEVFGLFSTIGTGDRGQVNQGQIYVSLTPRDQRALHQKIILETVRDELASVPGVKAFAAPVPIVGGMRGEPLQFVLKGPNLNKVAELSDQLTKLLQVIPEIGTLDTDLQLDMPQMVLKLDREKTRQVGLDTFSIGNALRVLVGGLDVAKYNDDPGDGERYDIRLQATSLLKTPDDLYRIFLRNRSGDLVRLDSVATLEPKLGAATIGRYKLQYAATFFATPTIPEGDAAEIVIEQAKDILPTGYQIELIGRAKEFGKTVGYIMFAFATGLILVYMTLASQFNSFIQPLIVMTAQPLAIIGAIFGLWLGGNSLNIYSMIGMVLLVGLVAKNSILLIDLTNQLRQQGRSINEALLEACPIRMRPVLMTSLTIIFSMLPAAMATGAGSDTNRPLAVAVIGGMISSTLLTLIVVPAVYSLIEHGLVHIDNVQQHGFKSLWTR
ncbi:MAG: AcrB/AcrD/AcrF family protein [Gammaproteobacteria bacterium]|nr:MAG: AcrB/AcrD/AcrF family protein [Gammaproteobacteria bacterium]